MLLTLLSEGLGIFSKIEPLTFSVAWLAVIILLVISIYAIRLKWNVTVDPFHCSIQHLSRWWFGITVVIAVLCMILLITGLIAPPNNTDSLRYHMPRILHWVQNKSLEHYPTACQPQLWNPIWSELSILNSRLFLGSDRLANSSQWIAMVLSLLGVTQIAKLFDANPKGQLVTAVFALSIPMGILQATSTQTDYVTALWLVVTGLLVVLSKHRELHAYEKLLLGVTLGLGGLTKAIFYPYVFPLMIWYMLPRFSKIHWTRLLLELAGLSSIVILLNLGYFGRNIKTFGHPLGGPEWIQTHAASLENPGSWLGNPVQHIALNFVTPSETINEQVDEILMRFRKLIGFTNGEFRRIWSWNHEDLAGNPFHFAIAAVQIALLLSVKKWRQNRLILQYLITVLGAFFVFGVMIKVYPYAVRHHLSFLILFSPLLGVGLSTLWKGRLALPLAIGLLVSAMPYVLLNRSRPLIGWKPRTMTSSIFLEESQVILFANWMGLRADYVEVAKAQLATSCYQVGLQIDSHDLEYLIWWLLQAPESGYRLEATSTLSRLDSYLDPSFEPCAVICTICDDMASIGDLLLVLSTENVSLYVDSTLDVP
jgi:4-amino-4-deoxy-L-arabinose transferase-like glycosyltransferase